MKVQNVLLGKIMYHGKMVGTGFFLDSKTILTALHVVVSEIEDLDLKNDKVVDLCLSGSESIQAKSLDLVNAISERVDYVLLRTDEVFEEAEEVRLIAPENDLLNYECKVIGYPKELGTMIELSGHIVIWEETGNDSYDMVVNINKQDKLQNYEGISGGPIIIGSDVIGFAVQQLSVNRIACISLKKLRSFLPEFYAKKIVISKIRKISMLYTTSIMDKCNIDFYEQHLKRALQIAGPRYVPELNVENETFALVDKILDKKGIGKELF